MLTEEDEMDTYPLIKKTLMSLDTYYRKLILMEDPEEVLG